MNTFRGNGKLLLTGEYVVLDGAIALALPTRFGQTLKVQEVSDRSLVWKSLDEFGRPWFEAEFALAPTGRPSLLSPGSSIAERLGRILEEAWKLSPEVLSFKGFEVTTQLEFPRDWGLGSSSTLIYTLSQWFEIDPYVLLENTFGGSGYDIAAAGMEQAFLFQRKGFPQARPEVLVRPIVFEPPFKDQLFFVHLNRKQNSRHSIEHYKKQPSTHLNTITERISSLTYQLLTCIELEEFEALLESHEMIISETINTPTIKSSLFPDYPRSIKSLGGWGGDFVLATGGKEEQEYFKEKGYLTVVAYEQMIISSL